MIKSRSVYSDSIEAALRLAEGYAIVDAVVEKNISSLGLIHVRFVDLRWAVEAHVFRCAVWSVSGVWWFGSEAKST